MKIQQLIEKLQGLDPEAVVVLYADECFSSAHAVVSKPENFDRLYSKADSFSDTFDHTRTYVVLGDIAARNFGD